MSGDNEHYLAAVNAFIIACDVKAAEVIQTSSYASREQITTTVYTEMMKKFCNDVESARPDIKNTLTKTLQPRNNEPQSIAGVPPRGKHEPKEDKAILDFAQSKVHGFYEGQLHDNLLSLKFDVKLTSLRTKLNRFCRSPKLYLSYDKPKRLYKILENGTSQLKSVTY